MARKPPARAPRVLWQGKYLDGFLLIVMPSTDYIEGTMYAGAVEFKLSAKIYCDSHMDVDTTVIVNEFIKDLEQEYKESEMMRMHKGMCDGNITLQ